MKRKLWLIPAAVVVAALVAVPLVHAEKVRGLHGMMHGERAGMMDGMGPLARLHEVREQLDLSDAQVEQIRTIVKDVRQQNIAYRSDIRGNLRKVAAVLIDDPNNVTGAQALLNQQAASEEHLRANTLSGVSKALGVLTPAQRTKLRGILDARANGA